jgi:6,7-dimethyl-8-ribityllumazine synthase
MSEWKRSAAGNAPGARAAGVREIRGKLDAKRYRVAIVASVFNDSIVDMLLEGAVGAWTKHGGPVDQLLVARVPGAFELPVVARQLALSGEYHAVVALGAVVRGDTPHFEYISGECASGLQRVSCDTGVPAVFGVLTVNTQEQALERASVARGNKGGEAMEVALEMADLLAQLPRAPGSGE